MLVILATEGPTQYARLFARAIAKSEKSLKRLQQDGIMSQRGAGEW